MSKTNKKTTKVNIYIPGRKISTKTLLKQQGNKWVKKKGEMTELEYINTHPGALFARIRKLLNNGRVEIYTREELEQFPKGIVVSYMTHEGLYRSGGFLTTVSDDYFTLLGGNPQFGRARFSVAFDNTAVMWVGYVNRSRSLITPVKTYKEKTNYPVKVGSLIVYYGKDNYDRKRFMSTNKYKAMVSWEKKFGKYHKKK